MGFVLLGIHFYHFMKTKKKTLWTRFDPGTRFEVSTVAAVPFRGTGETELEQFKKQLLQTALETAPSPELYVPLRRAANEAAAAAWMTPFPLLFLPALFEEKITAARRQL